MHSSFPCRFRTLGVEAVKEALHQGAGPGEAAPLLCQDGGTEEQDEGNTGEGEKVPQRGPGEERAKVLLHCCI